MRLTEKLILGTAQLGMSYGINNHNGKPSRAEAFEILKLAQDNGILFLDTAPGYGESQRVIGAYHSEYPGFEVITKFAVNQPFILTKEVEQSFQQLNIESIHCLMYHRFNDCFDQDIRNSLIELKHSGKIQKIGISVYGNDQFEEAISLTHVDVIQIPFNVLDNRNQRGQLMMKAKKNGKEIHVRSVFLQGLFFMSPNRMPESLKPLAGYLNQLNTIATGA
ncbi:MAG: aldo/keto reductase, partial [Bacteroidota bacterium]